jgi:hypothetical protein
MILWALSGIAMTLEPIALKALDPSFPKLGPLAVDPDAFARPVSELMLLREPVASVSFRQTSERAWFLVRMLDGRVVGVDARSGAEVSPYLTTDELKTKLANQLAGSRWSLADRPVLLRRYDEQYRKDQLPVYRVRLDGPARVVLYCSPEDGSVLKVTTLWSRFFRWAGMGLHTWNSQYLKENYDGWRRWGLVVLVALPLLAMGVLAQMLLRPVRPGAEERKSTQKKKTPPKA